MRKYSVPFLVFLLCTTMFMAFPCKADIVWSDNFDDGNYSGWMVTSGAFSAEDQTLKSIGGGNIIGNIVHPSFVATGTWSFDVLVGTETDIYFMYTPLMNQQNQYEGIQILLYGTHIQLYSYSSFYNAGSLRLGEYIFASSIPGWQHLDVTRNSDGRICIYHNETLILDLVDHAPLTSSEFFTYNPSGQASLDNIVVSNTIDIEPPPPVPFYMQTWFIATVFTVVAVAVVIVVLLMRRK